MRIAFVVYDGFNELDVFASLHFLGRAQRVIGESVSVELISSAPTIRSMYGIEIGGCRPLAAISSAAAVVVGSGNTLRALDDTAFMSGLQLEPAHQLIGAQCAGALVLAKLGLLQAQPACSDLRTRERLEAAGVTVLDRPFHARGDVATAGGCLAAPYLAAWLLWRLLGRGVAERTLASVAPVGEPDYVARIIGTIAEFV
ncbi:MAG TPA: DJ-1/PfpI family protein [Polyangiales bacterium]|nr:DJ-1/PfpI family protein [Polyangiales bacterium]